MWGATETLPSGLTRRIALANSICYSVARGILELGMNPTVFFLRFGHSLRVVVVSVEPETTLAMPMGLEPTTSSVTGWRSTLLNYGTI